MTNGFVGTATSAYVEGDDGVLYVQGYNIQENGFNFHGIKRVSRAFHARNQKSCLRSGDLLTIQTGDIGVTAVVPPGLAGANCHALVISRLDKRVSEPQYFCQYFNSERGRAQLKEIETGSTMKHLNVGDMKRLLLPFPPVEEQRAIATALSDVDALLAKLDAFIAKKRDLKQATMQQLLTGQTRLPGFSGEWEVKRLGDLGRFLKGSGVRKDESRSGDLPCVRYGEIYTQHDDYIKEFHSWISPAVASTALRLKTGDLCFAGSGETKEEIGKCVAFVEDVEAYAGGDIVVLRPDSSSSLFLGYLLNTKRVNAQKASKGQGDAVVHISATALSTLQISRPKLEEQAAIASVLADMDTELTALEARRDKTRALKLGMMQELLTGKIRLL
ncbi:restriction endonuclease subunit S [Hydrogenophaga sp. PAMC20947]|uniref:restriction endonuclease subunit S n=1 Tax=Hydrogenophaga sp. PAMC20947 TaxID=2565558 RepID=UPI001446CA1D|nr:restriction endonuclease subunit S [Hydrogenophaga sp. PAMC20947]